ncbi:hypothetical protein ACFFK0_00325 [Paenibacillus chartarius]|uniref:Uncharacterized protein n=1 Tax=Paenibacillus chartarius TaxID=747481 RepID=A0ABV6DE36_9BACL
MPVALFATVLSTIVNQIAWTYQWWTFKVTLFPWDKVIPLPTVYGVFLVGTIWIFAFTFRKFWLYVLVNLIVDGIYVFALSVWLNHLGVRESGNLPPLINLSLMTAFAQILYVYQMWQEGIWLPTKTGNKEEEIGNAPDSPRPLGIRARIKAK